MRSDQVTARRMLAAAMLVAMLAAAGCGGSKYSTTLTTPQDGMMLLIGSIIVENVGYRNERKWYTQDIEVSFMSDVEEQGRVVRKSITVYAENDGYFCVENVPWGKYALKGIRAFTPGGDWTIWNELRMPNERWMVSGASYYYSFTGEHFPTSPVGNVYNYNHNVFSVLLGGDVYLATMQVMEEDSFYLDDTYTRGPVAQY